MYIYVCMYIYIYIYMYVPAAYIYVYIYVYIYIYPLPEDAPKVKTNMLDIMPACAGVADRVTHISDPGVIDLGKCV